MVNVTYDGETLTAEGTTRASRIALAGSEHAAGPVVIPSTSMASVTFKDANPITNGAITIRTTDGRKVVLHFRRKQRLAFRELASALQSPR